MDYLSHVLQEELIALRRRDISSYDTWLRSKEYETEKIMAPSEYKDVKEFGTVPSITTESLANQILEGSRVKGLFNQKPDAMTSLFGKIKTLRLNSPPTPSVPLLH